MVSFLLVYEKYFEPQYNVALYGNLMLISVQFVIARLCLSRRFKSWMWRYAASVAITTDDRHLIPWLLPSALLLFILAMRR